MHYLDTNFRVLFLVSMSMLETCTCYCSRMGKDKEQSVEVILLPSPLFLAKYYDIVCAAACKHLLNLLVQGD